MPPFKFVTADDLRDADAMLTQQGVSLGERKLRLRSFATELEYERSKTQGPPLIAKAAITGAINMPADILEGITAIAPAGSQAESLLKSAATSLRSNVDPNWQRQIGEAAGGSLTDMATWEANIGSMAPMIAELAVLKKVGGGLGGKIGGVVAPAAGP
jgi:hypothetical protein